jgi:hypothetical protein
LNKQPYRQFLFSLLLLFAGQLVTAQTAISQGMEKPVPLKNFKYTDIGDPALKTEVNGFDIKAGGADIWGVKDEFTFVYMEHTGDFDLAARIAVLTAANLYTKAGLMAREDLTAGCRKIYFHVFPDNKPKNQNNGGYEFQYRQQKDGESTAIHPKRGLLSILRLAEGTPEVPVSYPNTWIRLQRKGNNFTGYYSTNGKKWKVYTTYSLDLPSKLWLGLAVTSHNTSEAATAEFRDIFEIK